MSESFEDDLELSVADVLPRILGVDYGQKRVGLAMSDPLRFFAQPVGTFGPDDAVARVRAIADADGVDTIVIGWPIGPNDEENDATEAVDRFVVRLIEALPGVAIVRWDERGSSREAVQQMIKAGSRRRDRARGGGVDRVAAALILQQFLDDRNAAS